MSSQLLDRTLATMDGELDESLLNEIRPILQENLREGRAEPFLHGNGDLRHYIRRVARNYRQEHALVEMLQIRRDAAAWHTLAAQLQSWAMAYLQQNLALDTSLPEVAAAATNRTAQMILRERFPYDLSFRVWTIFLLQRACRELVTDEG